MSKINDFFEILAKNNVSMQIEPIEKQINYIKPDDDYDFHTYRLLLLLFKCGVIKIHISEYPLIYGRRKFAFFDFLIRYPFYLEELIKIGKKPELLSKIQLKDYEQSQVFSPMIRYIRGPWDLRYDEVFNYMISKNLVRVIVQKVTNSGSREFCLCLTTTGLTIAKEIEIYEKLWSNRMDVINEVFPQNTTNKRIEDFILKNFPELILGGE